MSYKMYVPCLASWYICMLFVHNFFSFYYLCSISCSFAFHKLWCSLSVKCYFVWLEGILTMIYIDMMKIDELLQLIRFFFYFWSVFLFLSHIFVWYKCNFFFNLGFLSIPFWAFKKKVIWRTAFFLISALLIENQH